jgi:hypothetical protein
VRLNSITHRDFRLRLDDETGLGIDIHLDTLAVSHHFHSPENSVIDLFKSYLDNRPADRRNGGDRLFNRYRRLIHHRYGPASPSSFDHDHIS